MAKKRKQQKNKAKKSRPCDACVLITILAGDLSIFKAYFFGMIGKGRFPNIRRLGGVGIQMIAEDIAQIGFEAMQKKFVEDRLHEIRHVRAFSWNLVKYRSIDVDTKLGSEMQLNPPDEYTGNDLPVTPIHLEMLETWETGESAYLRTEQREIVRKVIMELLDKERKLLHLRYYEELSMKEIATIMEMAPNHVSVALHYIRKKLKAKLARLLLED